MFTSTTYLSFNSVDEVEGREETKVYGKTVLTAIFGLFTTFYGTNQVETEIRGGSR